MSNSILVIGAFDCNDRVHTFLEETKLGVIQPSFSLLGGPDVDIATQTGIDESALVESAFRVRFEDSDGDDLESRINSLRAELAKTTNTATYGLKDRSTTVEMRLHRNQRIDATLDVLYITSAIARVEIHVFRDPYLYSPTDTLYNPADESVRTNLFAYPSFELDTDSDGVADGWTFSEAVHGTPTKERVAGRLSGYAQRIAYTGVATDTGTESVTLTSDNSAVGSVAPGDILTLSFYAKGNLYPTVSDHAIQFYLQTLNAAGGWLDNAQYTIHSNPLQLLAGWTRYTLTTSALVADASRFALVIQPTLFHEGDILDLTIDDILIEKAASAGAYFDGDNLATETETCEWTGTANASPSIETSHLASFDLPAIVPLEYMDGLAAAPLGMKVQAPTADLRAFWAGLYPDETAVITDFVFEMHDKTWTAGVATTDAAGWPDGSGNTVWSDSSDALVTTSIDTVGLEPGEYLVVARCKTAVVHGDVFCGASAVEAEMLTAHVESTTLEWYSLGVVSLPTRAVRAAETAPLYIGIKSIATGTMYINCVALVPVSWGMVGWRDTTAPADALVWEDGIVYADDIAALSKAIGDLELRALGGVVVAVGGPSSSPTPELHTHWTAIYEPRWEQLPS